VNARSAIAAVGVLTLLAVDVVRQLQLGSADAGMWFFAAATCVGVGAALAIVRTSGRERMGLLVLLWLLVDVAGDLAVDWPTSRLATTLWMLATGLLPATYAWMVLAYPSGYVRGRAERLLLAVAFPLGLAWMSIPLFFADLRDCAGCSPRVPSLFYTGTTFDYLPAGRVFWSLFIALGVWFVVLLLRRLRDVPRGSRVTLLPVGLAAVFAVADFVAVRIVWLGGWEGALGTLDWIDRLSTLILPAAILFGLAEIQRRRGPLGDLMVELGSARPGEVGAALARAVGDLTLQLALWLPEERAFVDEAGRST
jgi:hypothetical protein